VRFRRDQGDAVLFALGIESFGEAVELEAARIEVSPDDLIDRYHDEVRQRLERLDVSCDWTRTVVTSRLEHRLRAQLNFLGLLERNLVYRRDAPSGALGGQDARWFFRSSAYAERCAQGTEELSEWTAEALETQRVALGRVDGVEVKAVLFGGGELSVFTPYADSIEDAAFVAVSPNHPEIDAIASRSEIERVRSDSDGARVVQTSTQAVIPGVSVLIPVVVASSVDVRFGPTASLGIPSQDETDRQIADRLKTVTRLPLKATADSNSKPKPAARYRLPDLAISRNAAWGTPIPVVHCEACAIVPMAADVLPDRLLEGLKSQSGGSAPTERSEVDSCECPKCGGPARRDSEAIDWNLDSMWIWLSICVPPADRETLALAHPEFDRWLPAKQIIWGTGDGGRLLDQRIAGRVAGDLDLTPSLDLGEPFKGALVHGSVDASKVAGDDSIGNVENLDELVARAGADVARLTILHAASPAKPTSWSGDSIRHSTRFLRELREYAEPRFRSRDQPIPSEIDRSTRLRRRLAAWCRIAAEKITANLERLEMHRATYEMMLLLKRIQDFEDRCANDGEMEPADRDAVLVALLNLVHLTAPCIPNTAAELRGIAGNKAPPFATLAT
jgi:leucyl-tRNA synthetase